MTISRRELKQLIMEVLAEDAAGVITTVNNTSITAELAKGVNRGLPISNDEFEKLSSAIKSRDQNIRSIDKNDQVNEVTFTRNDAGNNFYYKLRKISDPTDATKQSQYYVMWVVPFQSRIDIGKPGDLIRKESNPFNVRFDQSKVLDILFNFVRDALLMNI